MEKGGLQLLGDTRRKIQVNSSGSDKYFSWGIFLLGTVLVIFFILNIYARNLNNQILKINASIVALEKQRDPKAEENLLNVSQQATLMSKLLGNHIYWSQALIKLGDLTQSQVQIKGIRLSAPQETITFSATAANYSTIARQVSAFTNSDAIKDLSLGTLKSSGLGTIDFSGELRIIGSKFFHRLTK